MLWFDGGVQGEGRETACDRRDRQLDSDGTVEPTGSSHDPWLYQVDNRAGTEAWEYLAKADDDPRELFVFHTAGLSGRGTSSKLDDVILRDRDANATWGQAGDGTAEERTYYAR